jgi:hypothetical protein
MKPSEHLRAAKGRIERGGWIQGYTSPSSPCMCSHEAIARGHTQSRDSNLAIDEAMRIFVEANGLPPGRYSSWTIIAWNDKRGRTLAEVLTAFDTAITAATLQEQA